MCGAFFASSSLQSASRDWDCSCHRRVHPGLPLGEQLVALINHSHVPPSLPAPWVRSLVIQASGGSPGGGRKPCCCDSSARVRTCSQGKQKDSARPSGLWCVTGVQLQCISSAAQTTLQVLAWEERAKGALETAVSWLSGATRQVLRGRTETQMTKAVGGEHAASASLCLLCLAC